MAVLFIFNTISAEQSFSGFNLHMAGSSFGSIDDEDISEKEKIRRKREFFEVYADKEVINKTIGETIDFIINTLKDHRITTSERYDGHRYAQKPTITKQKDECSILITQSRNEHPNRWSEENSREISSYTLDLSKHTISYEESNRSIVLKDRQGIRTINYFTNGDYQERKKGFFGGTESYWDPNYLQNWITSEAHLPVEILGDYKDKIRYATEHLSMLCYEKTLN